MPLVLVATPRRVPLQASTVTVICRSPVYRFVRRLESSSGAGRGHPLHPFDLPAGYVYRVVDAMDPLPRNCVLVVDDDPVVRQLFQRTLELAKFTVVVASGAEEGLKILREDPSIGLVLLDFTMPGMDGAEFLQHQQSDAQLAAIPTVILSGSPISLDGKLNVAAFLWKPVRLDQLIRVVTSYCTPEDHP